MKEVRKQAMGIIGIRSYQDHSRKQVQRLRGRNIAEEASVANTEMSEASSRMCAWRGNKSLHTVGPRK